MAQQRRMASIKSIVKYWTSQEGFERIEKIEQDLNIDLGDFKDTLIKCRDLKESRCWACNQKLTKNDILKTENELLIMQLLLQI